MLAAAPRLRAFTGACRQLLSPALRTAPTPVAGVLALRQRGSLRSAVAAANVPTSFCRTAATGSSGGFMPSHSSPDADEADLLDEGIYRGMVDMTLENIDDAVTDVLEDTPGFDSTLADGVLSIQLGEVGTYVLNIQAPNRQVWLSSPISGPARYNFDSTTRTWRNNRQEDQVLETLLSEELCELTGEDIEIEPADI